MSPLNITTARAEAAAREEFVLLAERQVKDNENFLKQLVTNDVERILLMRVEIAPPVAPRFEADVKGGIRVGLELRPDYRSALLEIERRKINLVYAKNQALPRLDLEASVGLLGVDGSYRGSVDRTLRRDQTDWSAGVVFSVPMPNREARAGAESARLESTRALVELKRLEQQVVVEVDNASGQVTTARERITSTGEARKLALAALKTMSAGR
jgi:outer membrane protein TolC